MKKEELYLFFEQMARKAHEGQFRHDGVTPYLDHPLEVAKQFKDPIERAVAVGHDILEDGKANGVTYEYVVDAFLNSCIAKKYLVEFSEILVAISVLTHVDGETYAEYVRRVEKHALAKKVKIMDIICNLSDAPTDYQKKKYKKGMRILLTTDEPVGKVLPK